MQYTSIPRTLVYYGTLIALACLCLPADAVNNVPPCEEINIGCPTVCLTPTGVEMSWSIPTAREDGTPLLVSELASYTLYVLDSEGPVQVVVVNDGAVTSYVFTDLQPGTYMFEVAATDTTGAEGAPSDSVTYRVF